ncbi:protein pygopus-like isoform X3 [Centruroides sculpturatus]|uniref:protein pygopus-like isoform X3 n=1 Tax=Centruroides sculpturatus TaxID=218467 RepID=UPI000C6E73BB|nr:protein pygopus-like isoform X3 [Centruroides sculpturatus]
MPRERRPPTKFKGKTCQSSNKFLFLNVNAYMHSRGETDSGSGELKTANQPESPSGKKRRTSAATTAAQPSPSLPDLVPPPPLTGYGETIVASNPFDDTLPTANNTSVPPMPGPGMTPGPPMHPKPVPMSSGKVYPPDQPMVFNPQNPNAPPIYPCGICHKEVHDNDQAILCESGCNFWFHRACTGLTDAAYHLLTAEVYAEWVCDKCLSSKNIPLVKFKP